MATDTPRIPEQGVATLPDEAWERARVVRRSSVRWRSRRRSGTKRPIWRLRRWACLGAGIRSIRRARQGRRPRDGSGARQSGGGKVRGACRNRSSASSTSYCKAVPDQAKAGSLAAFHREVTRCARLKTAVPARNTVALRIASLDPRKVIRRRKRDAARDLQGGRRALLTERAAGAGADGHTVIDLIVVDDRDRQPIGRPTARHRRVPRCVLGMVVTLEAPSLRSWPVPRACRLRQAPLAGRTERGNGLADERQALAALPDNAAEFKSEALRRVASSMASG